MTAAGRARNSPRLNHMRSMPDDEEGDFNMKKLVSWCLLTVIGLSLCLSAPAEQAAASFCFNKIAWGMGKTQVRWLMGGQPTQESNELGGPSAMAYQTKIEGIEYTVLYAFLANERLYSVDVIADDPDREFFEMVQDENTELYGEPLTEPEDGEDENDPAAVVLAGLNHASTSGDGEYMGWVIEGDKVILLSYDASIRNCYVLLRRFEDCFTPVSGQK